MADEPVTWTFLRIKFFNLVEFFQFFLKFLTFFFGKSIVQSGNHLFVGIILVIDSSACVIFHILWNCSDALTFLFRMLNRVGSRLFKFFFFNWVFRVKEEGFFTDTVEEMLVFEGSVSVVDAYEFDDHGHRVDDAFSCFIWLHVLWSRRLWYPYVQRRGHFGLVDLAEHVQLWWVKILLHNYY